MIIDVVVPARTPQMDYLHHPECDASTVADMIRAGKSASEIARALGVSRFKVGKVIEFLDMIPNPLRLDYLNHPRCSTETAMQLRNVGHTFEEIGEHLGVSHELVRKVLRTYSKAKNIPIPPAKEHRWQRKSFRAQAATERISAGDLAKKDITLRRRYETSSNERSELVLPI